MKKIVLCGATHGSNFGDTIFAMMFYEYVTKKFPNYEFRFTELSAHSKKFISANEVDNKYLKDASGLIFISGGFFGESQNENIRGSYKRYKKYFSYGKKFVKQNKKICISGVGAGPIDNKFLRNIAVDIFNSAEYINVRDIESKEYMTSYGVNSKINVTTDSAICIKSFDFFNNTDLNEKICNNCILIHISEAIDFDYYKKRVLVELRDSLPKHYKLIIANDVEGNADILDKAQAVFTEFDTEIYPYQSPVDFLHLINSVNCVITPKLHVGIFASTFGKSVVSFPLHPEKTLRYYKQIGYPSNTKSLFEVKSHDVKELVRNNVNNPLTIDNTILQKSLSNFEIVEEFLNLIN